MHDLFLDKIVLVVCGLVEFADMVVAIVCPGGDYFQPHQPFFTFCFLSLFFYKTKSAGPWVKVEPTEK